MHWAMSLQKITEAENMVPDSGAYGAKARRKIFRETSEAKMQAHGVQRLCPYLKILLN